MKRRKTKSLKARTAQEGKLLKRVPPYQLDDIERRHRLNPDTFEIPSRKERMSVIPGDLVKLFFEAPIPGEENITGERMWVEVTAIVKKLPAKVTYKGILQNVPIMIERLYHGDEVLFDSSHVADIEGHG